MKRPIDLLYIAEGVAEREAIRTALDQATQGFRVTQVGSYSELVQRLRQSPYDLVLTHWSAFDRPGPELLELVKTEAPALPVVFIIACEAEDQAVQVLQHGAAGYVLQTSRYLRRLPYDLHCVLRHQRVEHQRDQGQALIREYAERLEVAELLDQAVDQSLRQYASRLEILREIDQAILEARSPRAIAAAALNRLQKLIPCQRASVTTFDIDAGEATVLVVCDENPATALPRDTRLPLTAFRFERGQAPEQGQLIDDITTLPEHTPIERLLLAEQIRAYLTVPLIARDTLIGSLDLGSFTPAAFTSGHLEIAREVAAQVAVGIRQARLSEQVQTHAAALEQRVAQRTAELQAANARLERAAGELRQLIATANAPIFGVDARGVINEWNRAAATITGYREEDVIGRHRMEDLTPEDARPAVQAVLAQALAGQETANFELCLLTKQGQRITVLLNASTRRDVNDRIIGVLGVGQDITERRRAEESLAWEAAVNAALAELSGKLMTLTSIDEMSYLVLQHAQHLTGSRFGFVGYIDPQTGFLVSPTLTRDIWQTCQIPDKRIVFETFGGLWGWVLEQREPLLTNAPDLDARSTGVPQGHIPIERFLSAPASVNDRVVGQIALANSPRDYTARDLALVQRLAQVYAIALERKRAEQELRQLSIAVEQSATVIVITDLDGNITFVNHAFETSTGYTRDEAIGQNPRILKTDHLSPEVYENLWETVSNGGVWSGEFLNKRKDGSTYWESAVITPITNHHGEIINYLAIKETITQRKQAEAAMKQAKEEAETANRLKSEFLANMSHEIRTPMNAILGFTDLLWEEEADREKQEKLEIIRHSGRHLLNLINDILDFSKIESGKIELQPKNFAIREVFDYLQNQFQLEAQDRQLGFSVTLADTVPHIVYGDESRITQILLNLVSNAFKFTREGSISLSCEYQANIATVQVADTGLGIPEDKHALIFSPFEQVDSSATRQHGGAGLGLAITRKLVELMGGTITFRSEVGRGSTFIVKLSLPPAAQPRSESPTPALPAAPRHEPQNTASDGDMMVQQWLHQLQGNLALEDILFEAIANLPEKVRRLEEAIFRNNSSELKFIIHTLRGVAGNLGMTEVYAQAVKLEQVLTQPDAAARHEQLKHILAALQAVVSNIPASYLARPKRELREFTEMTSHFRVLVAEDNAINQMLIQELLRGMFLPCDLAPNGKVALEKLRRQPYDIVLLDMQMPVMDGQETIQHIRADASLKELYVIALTAHALKGDAEKYLRLGCNDYLPKPIHREQFRERIYHVLLKKMLHVNRGTADKAEKPRTPESAFPPAEQAALEQIIQELRANCEIFDPAHLTALADRLADFAPIADFDMLQQQLYAAAETFDDQALPPIVAVLEQQLKG